MGKKKGFLNRKNCQTFRLVPDTKQKSERFQPTEAHLAEQQKYGVYYDDDYDYMQHLRSINEPMKLENVNEEVEKFTVTTQKPANVYPAPPPFFGLVGDNKPKEFIDDEISGVLDGVVEEDGTLEDDFIALAGGFVDQKITQFRDRNNQESDEESDEQDEMFDDEQFDTEGTINQINPERTNQRLIDDAFEQIMDREYNAEQIGELDGDDYAVGGCLEPSDGRLHKLVNEEKRNESEYDEELAKYYVRERMRLIESGVIKEKEETEIVEVDESTRKRMKWDCESFATQYSNIYNHPTLIKEPRGGMTKALKKFNKEIEEMDIAEENDEEMEEDDDDDASQVTGVSTIRPKNETPEQRKLRKLAVKEAKKARRIEKKANKTAFAEESRKLAKGRIGQIKARPI